MIPKERIPDVVKRSVDMDSNDFREIVKSAVAEVIKEILPTLGGFQLVKGYESAARALGVCPKTLRRWKDEGIIEGAYRQSGRVVVFDIRKVYEQMPRN